MIVLNTPKVYLIARPQIVREGLDEFLRDNDFRWPTPTDGVKDAELLVEVSGRCCFDDKTNLLTDEGWKLFSELNKTELVATLNPKTFEIEYQKPYAYQEYDYEGDLFVCEGRDVNFAVTPEHRQFARAEEWNEKSSKNNKNYRFITTSELEKMPFAVRLAADKPYSGGCIPNKIVIPNFETSQALVNKFGSYGRRAITCVGKTYIGKQVFDLAKLMVYYATEGSLRKPKKPKKGKKGTGAGITIYGSAHIKPVIKLCKSLGLAYSVNKDKRNGVGRISVGGGLPLVSFFEEECGRLSGNKKLPRWVLDLPSDKLKEIWNIFVITDGSRYGNGIECLATGSKFLVDNTQEILAKIGYASSRNCGEIITNLPEWQVSRKIRKQALVNKKRKMVKTPYKGKVYCVSTNNGVVLVRRNSKVMYSGNCYASFGNKAGSKTNFSYIQNLIGRLPDGTWRDGAAHGSVCEHPCWSFLVKGCGKGFAAEQIRHRVGWAYSELSTRYVDMEREKEEGTWEPGFCLPPMAQLSEDTSVAMTKMLKDSQKKYIQMVEMIERDLRNRPDFMKSLSELSEKDKDRLLRKAARGAARDVLPYATEAIMVMSANARALWNCIVLRGNEHAEAVIRQVYVQIAKIMEKEMPALFHGIKYSRAWDGNEVVTMPREKL